VKVYNQVNLRDKMKHNTSQPNLVPEHLDFHRHDLHLFNI
jgi:hypothetical protein